MVLDNWTADSSPKLVALERRDFPGWVKIVLGVKPAVAKKLVHTAMNLVGSGASNRVDYSAGGLAVLRRVVAGQDGELLNRVHTKASSENTARRSVRIVVKANPIQSIIVLLRACAGNGQLLSEAAIATIGAC